MKAFNAMVRMATVAILMGLAGFVAAQQAYPSKPMRIIIPFPPGGSNDVLARIVGVKLTESLGQQVIVDNRGGGNTIIGTEAAAKSPADGYTLLLAGSTQVSLPSLYRSLPFDVVRDFAPVATIARSEFVLVVHPLVPANSLQELIALARARPGQINYASSSTGGPTHLSAVLFGMIADIRIQHIPYKGGGPAIADLIGGQVQMAFGNPSNVVSQVKAGKIKAIAVSGDARLAALPQVLTFTEAGLPGMVVGNWYGFLVPAATPKDIVDRLASEIGKIAATPDYKERIVSQGLDTFVSTPEQFAAMVKSDIARVGKIIKAGNITLEQ